VCIDTIMKHSGHSKNSFSRASLGNAGTLIAVFIDEAANEVCEALSSSSSTLSEFWRCTAGIGVASVELVVCSIAHVSWL
jgi:hypothetical protein